MSTLLDLYNVSSLKQQSAGRHVGPLEHIILFWSNQSLLLLVSAEYLAKKQQLPIL
jgi:hypothetical protein